MRLSKLASLAVLTSLARANDIDTIYERQVKFILSKVKPSSTKIQQYITTLQPTGSWTTIDYTAGCAARRSSWPAGGHWQRILEMSAAFSTPGPHFNSPALRTAIRSAMEFWFVNDYKDATCMDRDFLPGGQTRCSCATPGMWNTNWYSNVIQVPTRLGKACTLLRSTLSPTELGNCTLVAGRSFAPFFRTPYPGYVSGANVIDMAVIGMSAGLLERNATKIADAYARVREQVTVQAVDRVDGIKPDGSFQQHTGIIYDGNYGKDFSNSLMELELQALGTKFEAPKAVQDVFGLHLGGARWMTFTNILTKVVHWDLTVIGRFVSYPVESLRQVVIFPIFCYADEEHSASANLRMDLLRVLELGNTWNQTDILRFGAELWGEHDKTANSGDLLGTRVFWDSDYMVHRTASTVTTLKMLSNRTTTSECVNSEGPYVFHLSDGVMYSYSTGAEYEDMFATLDWNIPPGITTDYGATPLECGTAAQQGIDTYAGGVVGQSLSVGAMRYVNPLTKSLRFHKAWFFFPDNVQHVLVSDVKASTTKAPVYSVLDQRLRWRQVVVNGEQVASNGSLTIDDVQTVWHSGTGYAFAYPQKLGLKLETKTGNWRDIGTSKAPLYTKDMFAAWVHHAQSRGTEFAPLEYSIFPATRSNAAFESKAQWRPRTITNSAMVSAAMDVRAMMLGAAFWSHQGGGTTINEMGIRVEVDRGVLLVLEWDDEQRTSGRVSVADPSHGTGNVNIRVRWLRGWIDPRTTANPTGLPIPAPFPVPRGPEAKSGGRRCALKPRAAFLDGADAAMTLKLPKDGMAGSTIMTTFRRGGY